MPFDSNHHAPSRGHRTPENHLAKHPFINVIIYTKTLQLTIHLKNTAHKDINQPHFRQTRTIKARSHSPYLCMSGSGLSKCLHFKRAILFINNSTPFHTIHSASLASNNLVLVFYIYWTRLTFSTSPSHQQQKTSNFVFLVWAHAQRPYHCMKSTFIVYISGHGKFKFLRH